MRNDLDLAVLAAGDAAAVRRVPARVGRAGRDAGVLYIRESCAAANHDVPNAILTGIFCCAKTFFAAARAKRTRRRSPFRGLRSRSQTALTPTGAFICNIRDCLMRMAS